MLNKNTVIKIEISEYICCCIFGLIYAFTEMGSQQFRILLMTCIIGSVLMGMFCLIKNILIQQFGIVLNMIVVFVVMAYIIEHIDILIIIFMVSAVITGLLADIRISIMHWGLISAVMLVVAVVFYDSVTEIMPFSLFFILLVFLNVGLGAVLFTVFTYRKNIEELQEHILESKASEKKKKELLNDMQHRVKYSVEMVETLLETLEYEEYTEFAKDRLNEILREVRHLASFSENIKYQENMENGSLRILKKPYFVSDMVKNITDFVNSEKAGKDIEFILDCDHEVPKELEGDVKRLEKVITSLLANAVMAVDSGFIALSIKHKTEEDIAELLIAVKDTGVEISKAQRESDEAGLRLNVAKSIIQLMGGKIETERVHAKGCEISFSITQKIKDAAPAFLAAEEIQDEELQTDTDEAESKVIKNDNELLTLSTYNSQHINTKLGLELVDGDEELYQSMLETYAEKGRQKLLSIKEYYDTENWKVYEILVHALKTTSMNIGAVNLSEQSGALERAVRDKSIVFVRENNNIMLEEYTAVLNDIEKLLKGMAVRSLNE